MIQNMLPGGYTVLGALTFQISFSHSLRNAKKRQQMRQ